MERLTVERIKKEMEGIHEEDLQRRLKEYYQERESLNSKILKLEKHPELLKEIKIIKDNIDLCIEVYEKSLTLPIIERAKRSAGLYKTEVEMHESCKKEEAYLSEKKKDDDGQEK